MSKIDPEGEDRQRLPPGYAFFSSFLSLLLKSGSEWHITAVTFFPLARSHKMSAATPTSPAKTRRVTQKSAWEETFEAFPMVQR